MQAPPIPADESTRLATLQGYNLLDTAPEERFDRLTRLARRMFGVPISLVSIIDMNRQWFKSSQGLEASETPRDISFCGHAILGDDLFVIPDALQDERFADNPMVTDGPHIRFYAGCPLKVHNGSKLGTLCIIDRQPREFNEEDRRLLKDLATMAEQEIAAFQLATLDELTGISNKRGFQVLAKHLMSLCERQNLGATLLFFDLDDFKEINDKCGHAEGNLALQAFANAMRKVFRNSDVFARLGGDEFVALLCNTDNNNAAESISRLQQEIQVWNTAQVRGYEIKYSVGTAEFTGLSEQTIAALLAQADIDMYKNKQARNAN